MRRTGAPSGVPRQVDGAPRSSRPTSSAQAADRSLPRKRESSFPPLGLLSPRRPLRWVAAGAPLGASPGAPRQTGDHRSPLQAVKALPWQIPEDHGRMISAPTGRGDFRCLVQAKQKQRVFCISQNTRCFAFYFISRPLRYRLARSKAWEAATWRTRSRPMPCWILRTQVPSGAARAR